MDNKGKLLLIIVLVIISIGGIMWFIKTNNSDISGNKKDLDNFIKNSEYKLSFKNFNIYLEKTPVDYNYLQTISDENRYTLGFYKGKTRIYYSIFEPGETIEDIFKGLEQSYVIDPIDSDKTAIWHGIKTINIGDKTIEYVKITNNHGEDKYTKIYAYINLENQILHCQITLPDDNSNENDLLNAAFGMKIATDKKILN